MKLNQLHPAKGSRKPACRVGRGIGSGFGGTCGRGTKGQYARNTVRPGFEGGQMPLYRRIPKLGFSSWKSIYRTQIRLSDLERVPFEVVTLDALKKARLINNKIRFVKIVASGDLTKRVVVQGLAVTDGARHAIEAVGGRVESVQGQPAE